jgi:hypothetical protein
MCLSSSDHLAVVAWLIYHLVALGVLLSPCSAQQNLGKLAIWSVPPFCLCFSVHGFMGRDLETFNSCCNAFIVNSVPQFINVYSFAFMYFLFQCGCSTGFDIPVINWCNDTCIQHLIKHTIEVYSLWGGLSGRWFTFFLNVVPLGMFSLWIAPGTTVTSLIDSAKQSENSHSKFTIPVCCSSVISSPMVSSESIASTCSLSYMSLYNLWPIRNFFLQHQKQHQPQQTGC